jgi:hypothetical protein
MRQVDRPAFCAQSTYNAFFSTGRLRGIRGARIGRNRLGSARNPAITRARLAANAL